MRAELADAPEWNGGTEADEQTKALRSIQDLLEKAGADLSKPPGGKTRQSEVLTPGTGNVIRLTRTVRPPASLTGEKRIENNLALIELRRAGEKPKKSVWDPAKKSLKEESHGKCAFCESPTSTVAYGDVEYFRPRSLCWWLAYCYDNFSL